TGLQVPFLQLGGRTTVLLQRHSGRTAERTLHLDVLRVAGVRFPGGVVVSGVTLAESHRFRGVFQRGGQFPGPGILWGRLFVCGRACRDRGGSGKTEHGDTETLVHGPEFIRGGSGHRAGGSRLRPRRAHAPGSRAADQQGSGPLPAANAGRGHVRCGGGTSRSDRSALTRSCPTGPSRCRTCNESVTVGCVGLVSWARIPTEGLGARPSACPSATSGWPAAHCPVPFALPTDVQPVHCATSPL